MGRRCSLRAAPQSLKVRVVLILALVALAAGLAGYGILEYGNPQWHRFIYIWQSSGEKDRAEARRPDHYTGTWKRWFRDGSRSECTYEKGKLTGITSWRASGRKESEYHWKDGRREGVWMHWWPNGQLHVLEHYAGDRLDGRQQYWSRRGILVADGLWRDGEQWQGTFLDMDGQGFFRDTYRDGRMTDRQRLSDDIMQ